MLRRKGSVVLIAAMALPNVDPGLYAGIIPLALFAISRANEPAIALLAQYQLMDLIGENQLYPSNRKAITAYRQEHKPPGSEGGKALT